jgi:hypothetical protein
MDPEFFSGGVESLPGYNYLKMLLPAGSKWFIPQGVPSWFTKEDAGGNVLSKVDSMFNLYKTTFTWNSTSGGWTTGTERLWADVERSQELTQWWRNQAGEDSLLTTGITFDYPFTMPLAQRFSDTGIVTQVPAQAPDTNWYLNVAVSTLSDQDNMIGLQRLANSILDSFMIVQIF